jgi:cell division protein FtsW
MPRLFNIKTKNEEKLILTGTMALVGFGLVMLYSASSVLALSRYGDPAYFLKRQALWAVLGLSAMLVLWRSDYRKLRRAALPMMAVTFVLLILVMIPGIGSEINGSRRWIRIAGLSLQPSELLKPAMLVFMAASLAKRAERLPDFVYGLGPYLVIIGVFCFMVALEPDFGTAAAVGVVTLGMLYYSGARVKHLALLSLPAAPWLYYQLFMVGFRKERLLAYIDPWRDPLGTGFQAIQSFLAFGSGGIFGLGLGQGTQKLLFLPEPHSDFIFSVIGEEFGLIGTVSVLAVYVAILIGGFAVALRCEDGFGRLIAFGVTLMISMQALINMGVTTGLFPNKGMPLPFISAGGTALLVALALIGMLLSVAREQNSPAGAPLGRG